jgi:protein TonB
MSNDPDQASSEESTVPILSIDQLHFSRWREALSNLKCLLTPSNPNSHNLQFPESAMILVEVPWYKNLVENGRLLVSHRDPPRGSIEPVEVPELLTEYRFRKSSWVVSLAVHLGFLWVALYVPALLMREIRTPRQSEALTLLNHQPLILHLPAMTKQSGGGGGGGRRDPTPASLGRLPRLANRQLTPPTPKVTNPDPILVVEPTLVVPQLASLPSVKIANYGDPWGVPGPPSSGSGTGGGIGDGIGGGVGPGNGPGLGPGQGGGTGGGIYRVGGGVRPPTVLFRVEPNYSEEARKANYQGTVLLSAIVRRDGRIEILRVLRGLGLGLDENAVAALRQWKFNPGTRNGEPVDVALNVEVNFVLR